METSRFLSSAVALLLASQVSAQTLTNQDIMTMTDSGMTEEAIIARISSSPCDFNTTPATIAAMNDLGVAGAVTNAMTLKSGGYAEAPSVRQEPVGFGLADVVAMLRKGYDTEIIINQIENCEGEVNIPADLETLDILTSAGADRTLLAYVQKRHKASRTAPIGLSWFNTPDNKPQRLNITALEKQSSGIGGGLLGTALSVAGTVAGVNAGSAALVSASWIGGDILSASGFKSEKLYIPGAHARMEVGENPVFRFRTGFDSDIDPNASDAWYWLWLGQVQSPNEFQLIRLQQKGKDKKAKRVFPQGMTWSAAGFTIGKSGGTGELVDFDIRQVDDRTYEITFPNGLEPGEYAFFYRNAMTEALKNHLSAFDFSVGR